ncbi:MAG: 2-hydroxyacid dehydrogenase [Gammaproteobacteria bacterium]
MKKPKVLVTRKWPAEVERKLAGLYEVTFNENDTAMSPEQLKSAFLNYDAVLTTVTDPINADILKVENKRAKIIGNFGVGFNNIDINTAKEQGLVVTNTPEVLTDCTADIAMLLLLMSARRGGEGERHVRNREWSGWRPTHMLGHKVTGKTLGLIGFGRIAQAVAQRAHFGFGMKIVFTDPYPPSPETVEKFKATPCSTIEEVLPQADFVSLHCPGGAGTKHLINETRLRLMKPTAHLINTARGDVVDSKALIKALKQGWIAGAGLDVFEGEPNLDDGFLELENISMLPHLGSATEETRVAMGNRVLENIAAFFAGNEPRDRVA